MTERHRHKYGQWSLLRDPVTPKLHLDDKEYMKSLHFLPMWRQSCDCGFENIIRWSSKPTTRFRFKEHFRTRKM